jgi:hypothetical protein
VLEPKKHVKALWLNTRGRPLGISLHYLFEYLEYNSFTEWVSKFVETIFPGKHITPITFRSVLVSLIFRNELHEKDRTTEDFLVKYSYLINTSYKVFTFKSCLITRLLWRITIELLLLNKQQGYRM